MLSSLGKSQEYSSEKNIGKGEDWNMMEGVDLFMKNDDIVYLLERKVRFLFSFSKLFN